MSNLLLINGKAMKNPTPDVTRDEEQFVSSARNANGSLTATKIGRRQLKFNSLTWKGLTREEWAEIREAIEGFYCDVTYYDEYEQQVITRTMYFGDCSAHVLKWDRSGDIMVPLLYDTCSCNIIDCGL